MVSIFVLLFVLVDHRPASPIEGDMIAEFDKNLTEYKVNPDLSKQWTT